MTRGRPLSVQARVQRAQQILRDHPALMLDRPHPRADLAAKGKTQRSWVVWMLNHAGYTGQTRACRFVERAYDYLINPRLPTVNGQRPST